MKYFILSLIFISSTLGFSKDDLQKLCNEKSHHYNADYIKVHKLKNGTNLYVCAFGENLFHSPDIIIVPGNKTQKESSISLGDFYNSYGAFGTKPVTIQFTDTGLIFTDHIPLEEKGNFIPAFKHTLRCSDSCIEDKKVKCVFKKLAKDPTTSAKKKTIFKLIAAKNAYPSEDELMMLYRSALAGDKKAQQVLLEKKFIKKMDEAYKDEIGEGFAHSVIYETLNSLKEAKCL